MIRASRSRLARAARMGALPLILAGCASLVERAPLVTPERATAAAMRGLDVDAAARGRQLYVGACARCHGVVSVRAHTPEQWRAILPRMAAKSRLDEAATRDLEAYIALTTGDPGSRPAAPNPRR